MKNSVSTLQHEIFKLESELNSKQIELRNIQKNQILEGLVDGEYYSISTSPFYGRYCKTYIIKYHKDTVTIVSDNGDSAYLNINCPLIINELRDNRHIYSLTTETSEYLGYSDIYINKLSYEEIKKLKKDINALFDII